MKNLPLTLGFVEKGKGNISSSGYVVIVVVCLTRQNSPFKQCTIPLASKWLQKVHHWWGNVLVTSFHSA